MIRTPIIAASAMDVNNSTVAGNIQAIEKLLAQGGVFDPAEGAMIDGLETPDVSEFVMLIHGDLGTGERITSLQQQRSIETSEWHHFQHVVFVSGLFHLKMAARQDETSLMHNIAQLRP